MSHDRRWVLRSGGIALAGALAGCIGGGTDGDNGDGGGDGGDTDGDSDGGGGGGGGGTETVLVGPGGDLVFDPDTLEVSAGTTVEWTWESDGHTVTPTSIPDDSDWEGSPGRDTYDQGYGISHTFEVEGTYEYICIPHEGAGMTGTVQVGAAGGGGSSGGGDGTATPTETDDGGYY